jgi:hypothetical protein
MENSKNQRYSDNSLESAGRMGLRPSGLSGAPLRSGPGADAPWLLPHPSYPLRVASTALRLPCARKVNIMPILPSANKLIAQATPKAR